MLFSVVSIATSSIGKTYYGYCQFYWYDISPYIIIALTTLKVTTAVATIQYISFELPDAESFAAIKREYLRFVVVYEFMHVILWTLIMLITVIFYTNCM